MDEDGVNGIGDEVDVSEGMEDLSLLTPLLKLRKDVKEAARKLGRAEARFLVDLYYSVQEHRIAQAGQTRSLVARAEPHETVLWFEGQMRTLERQAKAVLDVYSAMDPLGVWARSNVGIGPVISAGLLAHIDLTKAPTYGHVWGFAGLNPTVKWLGKEKARDIVEKSMKSGYSLEDTAAFLHDASGVRLETILRLASTDKEGKPVKMTRETLIAAAAKRPWNARLKVLCWKLGESFVKTCNHPRAFYGKVYAEKKAELVLANEDEKFAEDAKNVLAEKRIGKGTDAYKFYSIGKLPPAHVHARARRFSEKLFLSHFWKVGRQILGLPTPDPYPVAHMGHAHVIDPPNWPLGGKQ